MTDTAKSGDQTGQGQGAGEGTANEGNPSDKGATDTGNGGEGEGGGKEGAGEGEGTGNVPTKRFNQVFARAKGAEEKLSEANDKLAKYEKAEKDAEQKALESKGEYDTILSSKDEEIASLTTERDSFKQQAEEYGAVVETHSKGVIDRILDGKKDDEKTSINNLIGSMSPMEILNKQTDLENTFGRTVTNPNKGKMGGGSKGTGGNSQTNTVDDDTLFNKGNKDARTSSFMDELNKSASALQS